MIPPKSKKLKVRPRPIPDYHDSGGWAESPEYNPGCDDFSNENEAFPIFPVELETKIRETLEGEAQPGFPSAAVKALSLAVQEFLIFKTEELQQPNAGQVAAALEPLSKTLNALNKQITLDDVTESVLREAAANQNMKNFPERLRNFRDTVSDITVIVEDAKAKQKTMIRRGDTRSYADRHLVLALKMQFEKNGKSITTSPTSVFVQLLTALFKFAECSTRLDPTTGQSMPVNTVVFKELGDARTPDAVGKLVKRLLNDLPNSAFEPATKGK